MDLPLVKMIPPFSNQNDKSVLRAEFGRLSAVLGR